MANGPPMILLTMKAPMAILADHPLNISTATAFVLMRVFTRLCRAQLPVPRYDFSVGWAAMLRDTGGGHNTKVDNAVIRRVGVDPTGGTDPQSTNMQWGPEFGTGSSGRSLNSPDMRVTFKALANQVTVFVRIYNLSTRPSDKVFLDVMCVTPWGDIPVEAILPSPTPTSAIPPTAEATDQPTRIPPTAKPPTATCVPPTPEPVGSLDLNPAICCRRGRDWHSGTACGDSSWRCHRLWKWRWQ